MQSDFPSLSAQTTTYIALSVEIKTHRGFLGDTGLGNNRIHDKNFRPSSEKIVVFRKFAPSTSTASRGAPQKLQATRRSAARSPHALSDADVSDLFLVTDCLAVVALPLRRVTRLD